MSDGRFALIIANDKYEDQELKKLDSPASDAEQLEKVLKDPTIGGFEVKKLSNEPWHKLREEIDNFFNERRRDDLLFIYFACHGIKDEDGRLYFATANTHRKNLNVTGIEADFVNQAMFRSRSRKQVLLLDCCYGGAFASGYAARANKEVDTREHFKEGRGKVVITASDATQFAFEDKKLVEKGQVGSIFTRALVHGLKTGEADRDKDGQISENELYDYIHDRVTDEKPIQKPRKWVFDVEGNIIIAKNPNPDQNKTGRDIPTSGPAIHNPTGPSNYEESHSYIKSKKGINKKILIPILAAAIVGSIIAFGVFSTITSPDTKQEYSFVRAWGSQGIENGQFSYPDNIAIDSQNDVYVVDSGNNRVQKFTYDGKFITKWGSSCDLTDPYDDLCNKDAPGAFEIGDGQFNNPEGIAVDISGNVYVVDSGNNRVQKFANDGTFITAWGSFGQENGQFKRPTGVAVNSLGNFVYVVDSGNNRVQRFDSNGKFDFKWGSYGKGNGQFHGANGIAINSFGNVYVVEGEDVSHGRVQKFTKDGGFITAWGSERSRNEELDFPNAIAVDSPGNVYVVESGSPRFQKFTNDGTLIATWGFPTTTSDSLSSGKGFGQFNEAQGIAVDSSGNVYIADTWNHRIQVFAPNI